MITPRVIGRRRVKKSAVFDCTKSGSGQFFEDFFFSGPPRCALSLGGEGSYAIIKKRRPESRLCDFQASIGSVTAIALT